MSRTVTRQPSAAPPAPEPARPVARESVARPSVFLRETAERDRAWLRDVMARLELDATGLARKVGLQPSTLTRFMRGEVEKMQQATRDKIAGKTGMPAPSTAIRPGAAPAVLTMPRDVPVHGLIGAPAQDCYYFNPTAIDFAPRPPGIAGATRAFALRMPDATMDGWRRVNELVYVDPTRAVAEGDHALIEIANRRSPNDESLFQIRRVARRRPEGVVLATWGLSPAEERLARGDVLAMSRVLEWPELLFT